MDSCSHLTAGLLRDAVIDLTSKVTLVAGESLLGLCSPSKSKRCRIVNLPLNKKPSRWDREGSGMVRRYYARTTFAAWKPLGPLSRSNSTVSPSLSVR